MRKLVSLFTLAAVVAFAGGLFAADEEKKKDEKHKGKELAGKLLEKMDANSDGKVSKDEFKKFFEEKLKDKGRGEKAGELMVRLFDKMDANADGYLSKEEFA